MGNLKDLTLTELCELYSICNKEYEQLINDEIFKRTGICVKEDDSNEKNISKLIVSFVIGVILGMISIGITVIYQ